MRRIYWNRIIGGVLSLGLLAITQLAAGFTYHVDVTKGDDARSDLDAQNPETPWKTIGRGLKTAFPGDTVIVQPGTYNESPESRRDGLPTAPVIIQAASPGNVLIQPPAGSPGFFLGHDYHVVEGFVVTAAGVGLKIGPHDVTDGPVVGIVARYNGLFDNSSNGIQFTNAIGGVAEFNLVYQNGLNGISYSGNGSKIHDNIVHTNGQFGIYVKDGVDHQVWNNQAYNNGSDDFKIQGLLIPPPGGRTFYVDVANGNDGYDEVQAQNPATPWKTIRQGLRAASPGDFVAILPGLYEENVESVRDGAPDAPITIRAVAPLTVGIKPASGAAVYIGHHYHIVEGLGVGGGSTGLQLGPYDTTGAEVVGVVVRDNLVVGNTGIGIKFTNAIDGSAMHNVVSDSGLQGISYSGSGATIFNNLIYRNGLKQTEGYGITIDSGDRHSVINNTVYGNSTGGIQLGTTDAVPVFAILLNNIVMQNLVGIIEPAGVDYRGRALLDYNDVYNNSGGDYVLSRVSGSVPGPNSISMSPAFVDEANGIFHLSRQASGQSVNSPCIDVGSDTAEALGLGMRTAFTDKSPDAGRVDLGWHGTLLRLAQGTLTVKKLVLLFTSKGNSFTLVANLMPAASGDGIEPSPQYVEVQLGGSRLSLPTGDPRVAITGLEDGSVDVTVAGSLDFGQFELPLLGMTLRVGDDFGSVTGPLRGFLRFP